MVWESQSNITLFFGNVNIGQKISFLSIITIRKKQIALGNCQSAQSKELPVNRSGSNNSLAFRFNNLPKTSMATSFVPFTVFGNFCWQRHPSVSHSLSQSVSHSSNQLAGLNVDTFIFRGTCCCCRTAAATNIYSYSWEQTQFLFIYRARPPGDEGAWQLLLRHFSHCGNLLPNKINWQQHAIYGIYVKSEQTSAAIFVLHTKRPSWVAVNMVGKNWGQNWWLWVAHFHPALLRLALCWKIN